MSNSLVSVVINCHNSAQYLKTAIDSVFEQTYDNWEIIFWDNASSDESADIAKSYGHRIRYFFNSTKTNLGSARNSALSKVRGELVGFLDCDDVWHPKKLEEQIKLFDQNPNLGFVYSKAEVIDQNNIIIDEIPIIKNLPKDSIFSHLCQTNFIPFPSALCSTEKLIGIGGVPEHLRTSTDYAIFLALSNLYPVLPIESTTCSYRIHANMNSHSFRVISVMENIAILEGYLPSNSALKGIKNHFITLIFESYRARDYSNLKLELFLQYFSFYYFFRRVIIGLFRDGNSKYRI